LNLLLKEEGGGLRNKLLFASALVLVAVSAWIASLGIGLVATRSSQSYRSVRSVTLSPSLTLLGGASKWAAGNGTTALYVDLKDNWLNHHSTDGASWGPWGNEAAMDDIRFSVAQALTDYGLNVVYAGDIPQNLTGYDLLVLDAYFAVEPKHEGLIRDFVQKGGGVVLLCGVPSYLVVYCKDYWPYRFGGSDLSSIHEWFGASCYVNTGGYANVTVDNPFGLPLIKGDTLAEGTKPTGASVTGLNSDSEVLAEWGTGEPFAFSHQYGAGRVYYQAWYDTIPMIYVENVTIAPNVPTYSDNVVVSAVIKDGLGVDQAFLSYNTGAEWQNETMSKSDDTYEATIPAQPYGTVVGYRVYANDTAGRWLTSETYSYKVTDLTPPEITVVGWSPQQPLSNETVEVLANVSEPPTASGVDTVLFSYLDSNSQWWNTTMSYDQQSKLWKVIVPQQPHNTTVEFYITAYDKAGNMAINNNSGQYYVYKILPEFTSAAVLLLALALTTLSIVLARKKARK
jgi:hypothetical protein